MFRDFRYRTLLYVIEIGNRSRTNYVTEKEMSLLKRTYVRTYHYNRQYFAFTDGFRGTHVDDNRRTYVSVHPV